MKVDKDLSRTSKVKEASLRRQPFDLKENAFLILLLMEKIRRSPVEVGSLSHYLQGFLHPRISSINSIMVDS